MALGAIPRDATVYDNCRPGRFSRRRIPVALRAHLFEDEEALGRTSGRDAGTLPNTTSLRDELFQNALEELEDGEFGAHWNSSLNDVYADTDTSSRWRRMQAFQPIPVTHDLGTSGLGREGSQDGAGIADSVSSSSIDSDYPTYLVQNIDNPSRSQMRPGTNSNTLFDRENLARVPLLRRNSLRRTRYGRLGGSLEAETARRRLSRNYAEDADTVWGTPGPSDELPNTGEWRSYIGRGPGSVPRPVSTEILYGSSSGATFHRLWNGAEAAPPSNPTSLAHRNLRRGGLRAPESLVSGIRNTFNASTMTSSSSPAPDAAATESERLEPSTIENAPRRAVHEHTEHPEAIRSWPPGSLYLPPTWTPPAEPAPSAIPSLQPANADVIPTPPTEPESAPQE